jgi:hypothetical protein
MKDSIIPSEDHNVRRVYDAKAETWYFSVVNIVQRAKEGSEVATNCHQLKMPAADGKMRTSDAAAPKNIIALDPIGTKPKSRALAFCCPNVALLRKKPLSLYKLNDLAASPGFEPGIYCSRGSRHTIRPRGNYYWMLRGVGKPSHLRSTETTQVANIGFRRNSLVHE